MNKTRGFDVILLIIGGLLILYLIMVLKRNYWPIITIGLILSGFAFGSVFSNKKKLINFIAFSLFFLIVIIESFFGNWLTSKTGLPVANSFISALVNNIMEFASFLIGFNIRK